MKLSTFKSTIKKSKTGKPDRFYILSGTEYRTVEEYINVLKGYYKENIEVKTMQEVIDNFRVKSIFPQSPKLYIIRRDDEWIKGLGVRAVKEINNLNIIGTVVYVDYDKNKKLQKQFPNESIETEEFTNNDLEKLLSKNYAYLPDDVREKFVDGKYSYTSIYNLCIGLDDKIDYEEFLSYLDELNRTEVDEDVFALWFRTKDITNLLLFLNYYDKNLSYLYYNILNCLFKLEYQNDVNWNIKNVYNMITQTFTQLHYSRNYGSSFDIRDSLIYLIGLLKLDEIPRVEK